VSSEEVRPPDRDVNAGQLELTDPAVMRALAHPLRWAILENLLHAGTLSATQAGVLLGETPANCAFHLRTLARYGLVEEAGGGKGRERPWRRVNRGFNRHAHRRARGRADGLVCGRRDGGGRGILKG